MQANALRRRFRTAIVTANVEPFDRWPRRGGLRAAVHFLRRASAVLEAALFKHRPGGLRLLIRQSTLTLLAYIKLDVEMKPLDRQTIA
jgi:hypothetical protein